MKKYTLTVEKRTVTGRKVKALRSRGMIPATVYGRNVKSQSLAVGLEDFQTVYGQAGETGLVELRLGDATRPVLIHTVQHHPVTNTLLHVEFFQVDLKEKVKTRVPVVLVGESPAVREKLGVILSVTDEVEVEALPTDLPEHIDLDISGLSQVNQELKISDLKAPAGVAILTDPGLTVVKIAALVSKEAEAQAAAEQAAAAEAAAAAAPPAQVAPAKEEAGGEKPAAEVKPTPEAKPAQPTQEKKPAA